MAHFAANSAEPLSALGALAAQLILGNGRCFILPRGADVREHGSNLPIGELTAPCRHVPAVLLAVDGDWPGAPVQHDRDNIGAIGFGDVGIARQWRKRPEALTTCLVTRSAFGEEDCPAIGLRGCRLAPEMSKSNVTKMPAASTASEVRLFNVRPSVRA